MTLSSGFTLNHNSLTGPIPEELGGLDQLTNSFDLRTNQLCGDVPDEVSSMTNTLASGTYLVNGGNSIGTACATDDDNLRLDWSFGKDGFELVFIIGMFLFCGCIGCAIGFVGCRGGQTSCGTG